MSVNFFPFYNCIKSHVFVQFICEESRISTVYARIWWIIALIHSIYLKHYNIKQFIYRFYIINIPTTKVVNKNFYDCNERKKKIAYEATYHHNVNNAQDVHKPNSSLEVESIATVKRILTQCFLKFLAYQILVEVTK